MIKFIHTGDLHLGSVFENASFPADIAKLRREELFKTFDNIVKASVSLRDNFLLICGDLFEEKFCTAHDIKRVFDTLADLRDIEVLIIAGNHDLYSSTYRQFANKYPNIHIFGYEKIEKKYFEKFNTNFYAISWDKTAYYAEPDFSEIELDEDKINILMLHADCAPNSTYMPINIKAISDMGFDYIALGHIHKPRQVNNRAYYCGSPDPLDLRKPASMEFII
jgi:DNA repair exonuclease SbcCD nuclease subunit